MKLWVGRLFLSIFLFTIIYNYDFPEMKNKSLGSGVKLGSVGKLETNIFFLGLRSDIVLKKCIVLFFLFFFLPLIRRNVRTKLNRAIH